MVASDATRARAQSPHNVLLSLCTVAFILVLFAPFVVAGTVQPRLLVVLLALVMMTVCYAESGPPRTAWLTPTFFWCFAPIALAGTTVVRVLGESPDLAMNLERYGVVLPLLFTLGTYLHQSRRWPWFAKRYVAVALGMSVLAIVEWQADVSLLGRNELFSYLARDGQGRSLLASDHPLVLGMLLLVGIPAAGVLVSVSHRLLAYGVLTAGIYATGSRGPLVLAACLVVGVELARSPRWQGGVSSLGKVLAAFTLATIAYLGIFQWSADIQGESGFDYSTGYRSALYALLPNLLSDYTFGVGLGPLPMGQYTINSSFLGSKDLTRTIDSELVYLAFQLGILGLVLYVGALRLGIHAVRWEPTAGAAATAVTVGGLFVALHAWDTLGPLWFLLLGICWACSRQRPASDEGLPDRALGQGVQTSA